MARIMAQAAVAGLKIINLLFRPLKIKNKVTIISRQSNEPTLDIRMISEALRSKGVEPVILAKKLQKSIPDMVAYGIHMMQQMYHIATSKVVLLDGYCILVSILPKKEQQHVIQMWHALGAVKKFGWQNAENPDGNGREFAEIMCMHKNYDYVLAPSVTTGRFFAEAFRTPEEKLVYYGLPRIDFIRENDPESRQKMTQRYPEIGKGINVLYVPTFRKNAALELEKLVKGFDFDRFNLIIKKHFLDKGDYGWAKEAGAIVDEQFNSLEWLRISEKVITDYSAIAFEAAIAGCDVYIYQPDVSSYEHNVGLNIDMTKEAIGKYVCRSEEELFAGIVQPYDKDDMISFRNKYIEIDMENCTGKLGDFIVGLLDEQEGSQ